MVSAPPLKQPLRGGGPEENARITLDILQGVEAGPKLAVVLLNTAAALLAADLVTDLKEDRPRPPVVREGRPMLN